MTHMHVALSNDCNVLKKITDYGIVFDSLEKRVEDDIVYKILFTMQVRPEYSL